MKNLNKALAILVVITMMISTVAFAAVFTDVADDASYAEAVNVCASLNLLKGYEDGTFKADGDITRAEFAAVVVRMLGQEAQSDGAKTTTSFTDVSAQDWSAGYINIATRLGIVNGYGDGTFGPNDKVLYEQAIKMLVVALGYTPAIGSAGYPVGYLTKAGEIGITSGVKGSNGVAANRGVVAQLALNALDVPLMTQSGFATNLDYTINDGYGDTTRKTVMSEYLDVVKVQAMVVSSYAVTTTNKDDLVKVELLNSYKSKYGVDGEDFYVDKYDSSNNEMDFNIGTSDINSLVGSKAIVYVSYDDSSSDEPVVLYAKKDSSKTDELTVTSDNVDTVTAGTSEVTFEYTVNPDDRNTEKVTIAADSKLYTNGASETLSDILVKDENDNVTDTITVAEQLEDKLATFYGEVTLASNDKNSASDYDTVYITNYTNIIVDEVKTTSKKIIAKNTTTKLDYNPDDSSIKATLYDETGKLMNWEDLKEWDVISCKIVDATNKTIIEGKLVKNSITGKVTGKDASGSSDDEYEIDGKFYKTDSNSITEGDIDVGDEGTFYLDILGRIAYYDTEVTTNGNYAYVVSAEVGNNFDPTRLKIFNFKGEMLTLDTKDTLKVDGITSIDTELVLGDDENASTPDFITLTSTSSLDVAELTADHGKVIYGAANEDATLTTITKVKGIAVGDLITYSTDSDNQITTVDRPFSVDTTSDVKGKFTQYGVQQDAEYALNSKSIYVNVDGTDRKVYFNDKTIIMVAYGTDEDNYELFDIASMLDEQQLPNATAYNVDEDKYAGIIVVGADVEIENSTNGMAAVQSISNTTNTTTGDNNFTVYSCQNGEESVKLSTVDETYDAPSIGSLVMPVKNAAGEVKRFDLISSINTTDKMVTIGEAVQSNTNDKVKYYFGNVQDITNNDITLDADSDSVTNNSEVGTESNIISVLNSTNVYVYDMRISRATNRVSMEDLDIIDVTYEDGVTTFDNIDGTITNVVAVAREYDGEVTDVMLYILN